MRWEASTLTWGLFSLFVSHDIIRHILHILVVRHKIVFLVNRPLPVWGGGFVFNYTVLLLPTKTVVQGPWQSLLLSPDEQKAAHSTASTFIKSDHPVTCRDSISRPISRQEETKPPRPRRKLVWVFYAMFTLPPLQHKSMKILQWQLKYPFSDDTGVNRWPIFSEKTFQAI
jgi:hypothetical protein